MSDHRHHELEEHLSRLDALEERIRRLEETLQQADAGEAGPKYYESGTTHPELDDQVITP